MKYLYTFLFLAISSSFFAQKIDYNTKKGYIAEGFDLVSYFTQKAPLEGNKKFETTYDNVKFKFISKENLDLFKSNPKKYIPQYGGYCAWAMSNDKTAPGNAPFWTIYKEKLYLNYDQKILDKWIADKDGFIKKADAHWAKADKE